MQLLGHAGVRQLLAQHRTAADDDEDDVMGSIGRLRSRRNRGPKITKNQHFKVPSEEGQRLMNSGVFGSNTYYRDRRLKSKRKLSRKILSRELGTDGGQDSTSRLALAQVRQESFALCCGKSTF